MAKTACKTELRGQQVKKAGKRFKKTSRQVAELTDEVRTTRKKAEDVGKAIS